MKKKIVALSCLLLMTVLVPNYVKAATVDEEKATERGQPYIGYDGSNVKVEKEEDVFKLTLTGNATQDLIVYDGETVILDLNGYKLTNYWYECEAIKVLKGGNLAITDSQGTGVVTHIDDSTYSVITNLGTLKIEGGNYETSKSFYVVRNEGAMTINGGVFKSTSTDTSLIGNIQYEDKNVTPNLTINDGTFTAISNVIRNNENSVVTIEGGELTSESAYALDNLATAEVNGGTLTSTNKTAIRYIVDSANINSTSLKVSDNATLASSTDQNLTIYDSNAGEDVTSDYTVTIGEDGTIILTNNNQENTNDENEPAKEETSNPETLDAAKVYFLFGICSIIGIISTVIYFKKHHYGYTK